MMIILEQHQSRYKKREKSFRSLPRIVCARYTVNFTLAGFWNMSSPIFAGGKLPRKCQNWLHFFFVVKFSTAYITHFNKMMFQYIDNGFFLHCCFIKFSYVFAIICDLSNRFSSSLPSTGASLFHLVFHIKELFFPSYLCSLSRLLFFA